MTRKVKVFLGAVSGLFILCVLCVVLRMRTTSQGAANVSASAGAAALTATRPVTNETAPPDDRYESVLNEPFAVGDFSYVVRSVSRFNKIGRGPLARTASEGAKFVIVDFDETNNGNETATVTTSAMQIVADGKTFRASSNAMTALAMSGRNELLLAELQPGLAHRGKVAFEMPIHAADGFMVLVVPERGVLGRRRQRVALDTRARAEAGRVFAEAIGAVRDLKENETPSVGLTEAEQRTLANGRLAELGAAFRSLDPLMLSQTEEMSVARSDGFYVVTFSWHPDHQPSNPNSDPTIALRTRYWNGAFRLIDFDVKNHVVDPAVATQPPP